MSGDEPLSPTVGLFAAQPPRELLYAMGCNPVRIFPTAAKPTAAEAYLPRNFCSLNRLILASFIEDGQASLDAVVFSDEDDATRRLHDVWREAMPVPVWAFVEVPRAATRLAIDRYAQVLSRTAADLAAHTPHSLSVAGLRRAIAVYNEQRLLLSHLKRHWLSGSLNTIPYRRLRRMALTQDPATANQQLAQALQGLTQTEENGPQPAPSPAACRLLLLSELAAPAGLVRLVEAYQAQVVAEDSDLDERDLADPVPANPASVEEGLAALANAYLLKPPGPRLRDLPRRLAHISQLVAERGVVGAICAYSKFCDLYLAEFPSLKAHLEGLGVHVLLLELEDEAISGQHRTRVEAFLEMLKKA